MRNVFHVAKAVGTAAAISGNRVALGIGMGWCEEEFDLMEQPFRKRGKRGDEQLEVLRKVWTGEMVEHHGDFYDFPKLEMNPPVTAPVPVYVGGTSDAALKRAARNDGWISDLATTEELGDFRKRIDAHRAEYGRSDEPFAMVGSASDAVRRRRLPQGGGRRRDRPAHDAVVLLQRLHRGPAGEDRRHLPVRRGDPLPLRARMT